MAKKQATLEFGQVSKKGSDTNPRWVQDLCNSGAFQFVEKSTKDKGRCNFTLKCIICSPTPPTTNQENPNVEGNSGVNIVKIKNTDASNFSRHLKRFHKPEYEKYVSIHSSVKEDTSDEDEGNDSQKTLEEVGVKVGVKVGRKSSTSQNTTYENSNPAQKNFERHMLELVVLDGAPFDVGEGVGFRRLINSFDPKIRVISPRTIVRSLKEQFNQAIDLMKLELKSIKPECLHIITDIWSSRQKQSVIGVKAQFIKDWKMKHLVLGFKHFPNSHSSENIKKTVDEILKVYDLNLSTIASVTADNCSNVLGAFKMDGEETMIVYPESSISNQESDNESNAVDLLEILDSFDLDTVDDEEAWVEFTIALRNACLAHLLQLGIKDGITFSRLVGSLIKRINDIVNFFHKSNYWYTKLRQEIKISLLKACTTRWNSQFHCLKRIFGDRQEEIVDSINATLEEAKAVIKPSKRGNRKEAGNENEGNESDSNKRPEQVPSPLTENEIASLKVILLILEPFAQLTDDIQADSVTSSTVILGFLNAVKTSMEVNIDEEIEDQNLLINFRDDICKSIVYRFTNSKLTGVATLHPVTNTKRNIVTCDIMHDKGYVLASLLDPRIKTVPFLASSTTGTILAGKMSTLEEAVGLLKAEEQKRKAIPEVTTTSTHDILVEQLSAPAPKKARPMFMLVQQSQSTSTTPHRQISEADRYLKQEILDQTICPLKFWKRQKSIFPILSEIAEAHFGRPASSGGVERLFSIAGSIARARRARLSLENMEKILTLQQCLLNS